MKNMTIRRNQSGFTLTELLIAFAVISFGLVAIAVSAGKIFSTSKAQDEARSYSDMSNGVRLLYGSTSTYATLTTGVVITKQLPPPKMIAGSSIINAYGGNVTFGPLSGSPQFFLLSTTLVPASDCTDLITLLFNNFSQIGIGASNTNIKATSSSTIDPASVTTLCATASTNTINFIGN